MNYTKYSENIIKDDEGNIKIYDKDNYLSREGKMINDKAEGIWYIYGKWEETPILFGVEEYKNGHKVSMTRYLFLEKEDGESDKYYIKKNCDKTFAGRKIELKGNFLGSKPSGLWENYDESKFLYQSGNFVDGHPHGKWFFKKSKILGFRGITIPPLTIEGKEGEDYCFYEVITFIKGRICGEYQILLCTSNIHDDSSLKVLVKGFKEDPIEDYQISSFNLYIRSDSVDFAENTTIFRENGRKLCDVSFGVFYKYEKKYYDTEENGIEEEGGYRNNRSEFNRIGDWKFYSEKGELIEERRYYILESYDISLKSERIKELRDKSISFYKDKDGIFHFGKYGEEMKQYEGLIQEALNSYNPTQKSKRINYKNITISF